MGRARLPRNLYAFLIAVYLLSLPAHAQYSGGSGTADDPYQIATAADLIALGGTPDDYDKHFILTADIDLDPNLPGRKVFDKAVIAGDTDDTEDGLQGSRFAGTFNGGDHAISHLTVEGAGYLGLFGLLVRGAEVKNLEVAHVSISGSGQCIAGLVGLNRGTVTCCYSTGVVKGGSYVGALVGSNDGTVSVSKGNGAVRGEYHVGGLVGINIRPGSVTDCYSTSAVDGKDPVGGLVGGNAACVIHCYSTGAISGDGMDVGGLIGEGNTAVNSFWDMRTSGRITSAAGKGRTTDQMKQASNYKGWNSRGQAVWTIDERQDYPRLAWEAKTGARIPSSALDDYVRGTGTQDDPYVIETPEQFNLIGLYPCEWDKCFLLMSDIDLSGYQGAEYNVIGTAPDKAFTGVFSGKGHVISAFTYISLSTCNVGLFGCIGVDGIVRDVAIQDVNLSAGGSTGGLAGFNSGRISQCRSTNTASGDHGVDEPVERKTGTRSGSGTRGVAGIYFVGGIVGDNAGAITGCYVAGPVSGRNYVGGLVGRNDRGSLSECYSAASVKGTRVCIGGLVGHDWEGQIRDCFWDTQTSGQVTSSGGIGKTTAEMQMAKTFLDAGWDFIGETENGTDDIWWILEGQDYPRLWWEREDEEPEP